MVISVMKDKKARPLSAVRAGEKVRLKRIDAGQGLNALKSIKKLNICLK